MKTSSSGGGGGDAASTGGRTSTRGSGGSFGGSFSFARGEAVAGGAPNSGRFSASVGVLGSGEASVRGMVDGVRYGVGCTGPSCKKSISGSTDGGGGSGGVSGGGGGGGGGSSGGVPVFLAASGMAGDIGAHK